METKSVAQRAIALITERGAIRTDQIAEALDVEKAAVASSLGPYVNNGTLVACKVERPGGGMPVNEYRISAGGKTAGFREYKPKDTGKKTPPRPVPAERATETPAKPKRAYKRSAPMLKVQRKTATKIQEAVTAKRARQLVADRLRMKDAALRTACAAAPASAFRTAIASDGAMLFLGAAAGAFELNRGETRAVIEFVRTLDSGEVGA